MFHALYLQGSLLLGGAHIVKEEWKYVREVRGLCSDSLSQVKVLWNRQDKQDNPRKDRSWPTNNMNVSKTYLCWQTLQGCRSVLTAFLFTSWNTSPVPTNCGKSLTKATGSWYLALNTTITIIVFPRKKSSSRIAKVRAIPPMLGGGAHRVPVTTTTRHPHYWVTGCSSICSTPKTHVWPAAHSDQELVLCYRYSISLTPTCPFVCAKSISFN